LGFFCVRTVLHLGVIVRWTRLGFFFFTFNDKIYGVAYKYCNSEFNIDMSSKFKLSFKKIGIEEAITPLDGRNRNKIEVLAKYFSEEALNRKRILIEVEYLIKLSEIGIIRKLKNSEVKILRELSENFSSEDYKKIREIEAQTNHDVKAVELFLQSKLPKTCHDIFPMVHFGLTSEDINNLSYAMLLQECLKEVIIPDLEKILKMLKQEVIKSASLPMLGHTHGQAAAPTTLGKEYLLYKTRVETELATLKSLKLRGKLMGNTGNLNVHKALFPKINWLKFSSDFVKSLKLEPDLIATQILPYDSLIKVFQSLIRLNNIFLGFCVDFWIYASMGYLKQKVLIKEVGSSALPHKVNPIYLEGGEGGFGIANALLGFYVNKLASTRMQRDLSDNTVRRSSGIAIAYCLLSYQSILESLDRLEPNEGVIKADLFRHYEVLSEAIQNFLRIKGYDDAYEKTKQFFRGKILTREGVEEFIVSLGLDEKDKQLLLGISLESYTGYAEILAKKFNN